MKTYELFETLAATVWYAIPHARARKIQLGEDAITTMNLLALDAAPIPTVIVEDTRIDESTKGADWEFWIGSDLFGWNRYAVQAKKINPRLSYDKLGHRVKASGMLQIDILERYAKANRAAPIYCLYNSVPLPVPWHCNPSLDPKQLGCSVTPSRIIRKALAKRGGRMFSSIHSSPETLPWRCLVKCPIIVQGGSVHPNVLAVPDINNHFEELPPELQRRRVVETALETVTIQDDLGSLFNREVRLRPRWLGLIDLSGDL